MMPMHFPYGNNNTAGQPFYGTAVYPSIHPNFALNYNSYFTPFYSNSNGLLPPPTQISMPSGNKNFNIRECKPLILKSSMTNSSSQDKKQTGTGDFLTFIEQKTKRQSELNPFANEFSVVKTPSQQTINSNNENMSSYKLIFDDLIEKSLQSIEAIKKSSKTMSVNHVSIQCDQSIDQMNRSTQTTDDNDKHDLLKEYSSHTINLMNSLLKSFKYLLLIPNENDLHSQLKLMGHICDEIHHLILFINQILSSNKSSIDIDNPFSNMIKDLSNQSSPFMFGIRGHAHRLISSSMSYSPTPSFSSRLMDPIMTARSKICLLCQKPVDDGDDVMHKLCRLLSSPPDMSIDI